MNKDRLFYRASAASFTLALACISLATLCGWSIAWLLQNPAIQQLCCRLLSQHAAMTGMWPDLHLWPIIAIGLVVIGLLTLVRLAWQTSRRTRQLLAISQIDFPQSLKTLLAELHLESNTVLVHASEPLAFCYGFLRPRICLSTRLVDLLSPAQLKAALLHEEYHRQQFDPLRILFIETVRTVFFFLPAIREWGALAKIKLEVAADRYAISQAGKPALAGALHRLLTHHAPSPSVTIGTATAGLSANAARIAELLGERSTPQHVSPQSLLHSAAVILLLCPLLML